MRKSALITGSSGYVGSFLARQLARDGWEVHAVAIPEANCDRLRASVPSAVVHVHDGSTSGLFSIVGDAGPTVVFHLASLFLAQHRPEDIEPLVRSNILFGTQLAEAMQRHGVKFLVNTGTSWQHYDNAAYDPVCLYAATKQAFEDMLRYYTSAAGLSVITLKLFDTYGPDDPRPKLFTLLRRATEEGTPLAMSPGEQLLDLVYIDDVISAFTLAAERLLGGSADRTEEYAVSSHAPISLRDLVGVYSRVTGKRLDIQWGERQYRPREVMVPWNSGRDIPGWEPKTNLEQGIKLMMGLCQCT